MKNNQELVYESIRDYTGYALLLLIPITFIAGILLTKELVDETLFASIHEIFIASLVLLLIAFHSYFGIRHKLLKNNKWNTISNIIVILILLLFFAPLAYFIFTLK
jgi:succinate dehydrogenase hydrophobic anchor subunit